MPVDDAWVMKEMATRLCMYHEFAVVRSVGDLKVKWKRLYEFFEADAACITRCWVYDVFWGRVRELRKVHSLGW